MSRTEPLSPASMAQRYLADGRTSLTPAQERRIRHKENSQLRGTARIGRLRRRYDKNDAYYVRQKANWFVSQVRTRVSWSRFTPKPNSKVQRSRASRRGNR